jgi:hypothetical protein
MGIETNTIGQNKALLPAFRFNWSQMESESDTVCVPGDGGNATRSSC